MPFDDQLPQLLAYTRSAEFDGCIDDRDYAQEPGDAHHWDVDISTDVEDDRVFCVYRAHWYRESDQEWKQEIPFLSIAWLLEWISDNEYYVKAEEQVHVNSHGHEQLTDEHGLISESVERLLFVLTLCAVIDGVGK